VARDVRGKLAIRAVVAHSLVANLKRLFQMAQFLVETSLLPFDGMFTVVGQDVTHEQDRSDCDAEHITCAGLLKPSTRARPSGAMRRNLRKHGLAQLFGSPSNGESTCRAASNAPIVFALLLLVATFTAGCGGGGSSATTTPPVAPPPPGAAALLTADGGGVC